MAMNGTQMGDEIAAAIMATVPGGQLNSEEQSAARQQWRVIGQAIVAHIQNNAEDSSGGDIT
jgi:hypothetical protein